MARQDEENAAKDAEKSAEAKSADKPKTHTVKSEPLKIELKLNGTFDSVQTAEVSLRPESWSKLEVKKAIEHGATVQAGETLVELDLTDLRREIAAARRALILSELNFEEAKVAYEALKKTTPIDLESAKRDAKNAEADLAYFLEVTLPQSRLASE